MSISDSQFIDLIEKNPVIWNRKSKEFRNLNNRLETWESLAQFCGTNSITVQKRWKSLREKYVRERKYWQNIVNRPGIKAVKQRWELCNKMHFIAPYCLPRANHSPKPGAENDDFDADLSVEMNLLPQQIKDEVGEPGEDKEFSFNCSPTSTMPTANDTDTSSLTNRTAQIISSTTTNQNQLPQATSDDDYAESSASDSECAEETNALQSQNTFQSSVHQQQQQQALSEDEHQVDDRKRKFAVFGKFVCEELISLDTDEAEVLYTRILSEVLNFRVRKQMRNSL